MRAAVGSLRLSVLLLLAACAEKPTAPAPGIPATTVQRVTPTIAFLRAVDSLNASMRRFYEDSGTVTWIAVTYDSANVPTLHFSLSHQSLR